MIQASKLQTSSIEFPNSYSTERRNEGTDLRVFETALTKFSFEDGGRNAGNPANEGFSVVVLMKNRAVDSGFELFKLTRHIYREHYVFVKFAFLFSANAAIPSFWSLVAKSP